MFEQFVFDRQWRALRAYAGARGVSILGDVPFYVAGDSADAWCRPELFKLDEAGRARAVAGVPPDAFSETGQLWGNPVYDWPAHARDDFAWWRARTRRNAEWFDAVRLDHFRGFAAHWEVPVGSRGAAGGRWVDGPGDALVRALVAEAGGTRLVAEDLGLITDDVRALMRAHALPGMKVLLFAFDGGTADNPHAPHHHAPEAVVYTGTHDNNTARGWFEHDAGPAARAQLARHLGRPCGADEVAGELVRMAMTSVCRTAIIPAQDLLGLGEGARMNRPATAAGNWAWRLTPAQMGGDLADALADLTEATGRA
jgi:4-alpha-glucanotransferase